MTQTETLRLMDEFAQAWNRHDEKALVLMMCADAVFETAAGAEVFGTRHAGSEQLARAFASVWEAFPDSRWDDATHVASGEHGFSEWTYRGTDRNGKTVEVRGVDLFVFRDGKIAKKDTFRKNRTR